MQVEKQSTPGLKLRKKDKYSTNCSLEKTANPGVKIVGKAIRGDGRGKELGFPTINIQTKQEIDQELCGVWAGRVLIKSSKKTPLTPPCQRDDFPPDKGELRGVEVKKYDGSIHIGPRMTFDQPEIVVECHLFDFSEMVTEGVGVEVILREKIRDPQKFASAEELVKQMEKDVKMAKKHFNEASF